MEEPGKPPVPSVVWPEAAGDASPNLGSNICSQFCSETEQPQGSSTQGSEISQSHLCALLLLSFSAPCATWLKYGVKFSEWPAEWIKVWTAFPHLEVCQLPLTFGKIERPKWLYLQNTITIKCHCEAGSRSSTGNPAMRTLCPYPQRRKIVFLFLIFNSPNRFTRPRHITTLIQATGSLGQSS